MSKIEERRIPGIEAGNISLLNGIIAFFKDELSRKHSRQLETQHPYYGTDRVDVPLSNPWLKDTVNFFIKIGHNGVGWASTRNIQSDHTDDRQKEATNNLIGLLTGYYRDKFKPDDDPSQMKTAIDYGFCLEENGSVVIPGLDHALVLTPNIGPDDRIIHGTVSLREIAPQT